MVFPVSKHLILSPLRLLFIKRLNGLNNLPKNSPYILAANHSSYIDPFLIAAVIIPKINKKIRFISVVNRVYNFFGNFISSKWAGCIPIYDKKEVINQSLDILKNNGIIGIHPEGRRTHHKNQLLRAHTGAIRFSIFTNSPLVPLAIRNTFELWPYNKTFPRLEKIVEIRIGKPYYINPPKKILEKLKKIGPIADKNKNPETYSYLRKETKRLMEKIASLLNQKYIEKQDYAP